MTPSRPDLPPAAGRRLRDADGRPSSSALGVAEALSLRQAGLEPISLVMGIAYYNVGRQGLSRGAAVGRSGPDLAARSLELENLTTAWNEARRLWSSGCAPRPRRSRPTPSSGSRSAARSATGRAG